MIIKICAWCKRPMGVASRILSFLKGHERITHGICWSCQEHQLRELKNLSHRRMNTHKHIREKFREIA